MVSINATNEIFFIEHIVCTIYTTGNWTGDYFNVNLNENNNIFYSGSS